MTAQARDSIIYKGEKLFMASEPLNSFLKRRGDVRVYSVSTMCWRGYLGSWEVKDNKLYLIGFSGNVIGYGKADLDYLFPGQNAVFANWFSGEIRIQKGKLLRYVHMGYSSIYENEIILVFEKGELIEELQTR